VGCKSDCEKVCDDLKNCAGADASTKSTDCSKSCDEADKQADKEGCKSQQDDLLSCVADNDICTATSLTKCASQASAYDTCYTKYCTAHPDDADCDASSGGIP
jgi:hypothetical protein